MAFTTQHDITYNHDLIIWLFAYKKKNIFIWILKWTHFKEYYTNANPEALNYLRVVAMFEVDHFWRERGKCGILRHHICASHRLITSDDVVFLSVLVINSSNNIQEEFNHVIPDSFFLSLYFSQFPLIPRLMSQQDLIWRNGSLISIIKNSSSTHC